MSRCLRRSSIKYPLQFRFLALVDKLYTAQKVREDAMVTRMKILVDEKDELYKRIRKLEKDQGYACLYILFLFLLCL